MKHVVYHSSHSYLVHGPTNFANIDLKEKFMPQTRIDVADIAMHTMSIERNLRHPSPQQLMAHAFMKVADLDKLVPFRSNPSCILDTFSCVHPRETKRRL
jgi:hypothetical protein